MILPQQQQNSKNFDEESDLNYALLDDDGCCAHQEDQLDMMEHQQQQLQHSDADDDDDDDNSEDELMTTKKLNRTAFGLGFFSCFSIGMLAYPYGLLMLISHQSKYNNDNNIEESMSDLLLWFEYYVLDATSHLLLFACMVNLIIMYAVASEKGYQLLLALVSSSSFNVFGNTFQAESSYKNNNDKDGIQTRFHSMATYFGSGFIHGSFLSEFVILLFMGTQLPDQSVYIYISVGVIDTLFLMLSCFGIVSPIL